MDRLSRNDVVSFQIRQIIKKHNVKLYVGSQNEYDLDNPSDKLMFTMEGYLSLITPFVLNGCAEESFRRLNKVDGKVVLLHLDTR